MRGYHSHSEHTNQPTTILIFFLLTVLVSKGAVFRQDVGAGELDVLEHGGFWAAETGGALLDVVQQALRHKRVLVQVHQVRRLTHSAGAW